MDGVRHLSIEIGPHCNLAHMHYKCPAHNRVIDREILSVDRIVTVIQAALFLGFKGFVGFHFYNEPSLYSDRMDEVMSLVPEARYMLWTNSDYTDPRFSWYERSNYGDPKYKFDDRILNYETQIPFYDKVFCWRPTLECAIDYSGRVAMCCQDWKLTASTGDISKEEPLEVLTRWCALAVSVRSGNAPGICKTCTAIQNEESYHDALTWIGME
jgi:hypothetical protein